MSESMARMRQTNLFYRIMKYRMGVGRVSAGCRKGVELWSKLRQKCTIVARIGQNVDTCDTLAIPLRRGGVSKLLFIYTNAYSLISVVCDTSQLFFIFSATKK